MIILKSPQEIDIMRAAGRLTALTIAELKRAIRPGVTTAELDALAEDFITRHGGIPAFKGYQGFPGSICASINEEVVHGIPGLRQVKSGDIISIDIGAIVDGYVGDAAFTAPVGEVSEEALELLRVTEEALYRGIAEARPGRRLSDISHAIQAHAEKAGFSVVRDYVGHGIGTKMHEDPPVPNYGPPGRGPRLQVGMVLAIEPMVNRGTYEVRVLPNGWTVVTADGSLSAHFEHTVAITEAGPEILTRL
ncbi:MAG: methionyl aminopeptidase [Bacillota bacterium]|nr:methionyl aminopeptidase [Bacillota bacterium]MDK2924549.1 methionyl aminopeptidase [Bacillota bacterium]